ncbi:MAG: GGDEF domain-containing protein [Oscillospiraceae bacterium]|nr:GGDEF domain-containing protein [Oscillospiraceae bacterium]
MKRFIGLCTAKIDGYFQTEFYCAALERAREYGYGLLVFNSGSELDTDDKYSLAEAKVFDLIDYDRIDGLILLAETIKNREVLEGIIKRASEHGVFVVSVDKALDGCYNIQFNYQSAFEAVVRHVIEKHGCRVINVMAGMRNNVFSDERIECCRRVMRENGLELDDSRIMYGNFWSGPAGRAMDSFFESDMSLPDAFICCNDTMAMTVCAKLRDHGYSVPDDVIVTGFDGIPDEQFHIPRLTTAKQGTSTAGVRAVDAVIANSEGRLKDNFAIIDHAITWSHSCGCKPIDYREASGRIQVLFDMIQDSANAQTEIAEMNEAVSYSEGLQDVSGNIFAHTMSYGWSYYCLCLSDDFMNISTDYKSFIEADDTSRGARLILCESFEGERTPPYCGLRPARLNEAMEHFGTVIFWPIHFSDTDVGYGVCSILPEKHLARNNGTMRNFPGYTRNINHALEIANSQSVMKKVIKELQRLYVRDHTGLYNRRGFYNEISKLIDSAVDDGGTSYLTVLSIDMDGLKTINDTYGHAEGDIAINAISDALHSIWGENEICSRFGGDEFTVASVCRSEPEKHADKLAHDINEHIAGFNAVSGKPYTVRVSFGSAYTQISRELHVDELIKCADDLMYREKSTHEESRYGSAPDRQ